jgi:TonB family protein
LVKGAVVERVLPEVPEAASETIRGAALLNIRVHVDADGHASEASLDSPGASRYFGNLAQQAALRWKFKPARIDGAPVPSVWELHFAFHQDEIDVTPMEESPQ